MFPNKLPSRTRQHAQSLIIFSALESTKTHVEFSWSSAVALFINDMMRCFAFQKGVVGASAKVKRMHPQLRNN